MRPHFALLISTGTENSDHERNSRRVIQFQTASKEFKVIDLKLFDLINFNPVKDTKINFKYEAVFTLEQIKCLQRKKYWKVMNIKWFAICRKFWRCFVLFCQGFCSACTSLRLFICGKSLFHLPFRKQLIFDVYMLFIYGAWTKLLKQQWEEFQFRCIVLESIDLNPLNCLLYGSADTPAFDMPH